MYKVNVVNNINGKTFGTTFETEQEANDWINSVMSNKYTEHLCPWGNLDRWLDETDGSHINTREVEIDIDENEEPVMKTQYFFVQDFNVEVVDITEQHNQQLVNEQSLKFLSETDYRVLRHVGQKALGLETSMTEQEYLDLEQARQEARESIVND